MKKIKWYSYVGYFVVVLVTTMFIRIPIPTSSGYFNFGDVAVVFSGLMLGKYGGFVVGGLASGLADILGGYAFFSWLTIIAKGGEGFFCGIAKGKGKVWTYIFPLIGCLLMAAIYFVGEVIMPQVQFAGAIAELPANFIQAGGGYFGGRLLFEIYNRIIVSDGTAREK